MTSATDIVATALAVLVTLVSAAALYAGSPHAPVRIRGPRPAWRIGGGLAALIGLGTWIALLGGGAGLCAMLAVWMVGMMAAPWLGLGLGLGLGLRLRDRDADA